MIDICFIDDDADNRRQWLEWADYSGINAKAVESVFEANRVAAEAYVFDVTSVAPMNVGHHAYSPICRLMEDHPGAEIYIGSCMSRNAVEEIIDDVETVSGRRPKYFDAADGFRGFERVWGSVNRQAPSDPR